MIHSFVFGRTADPYEYKRHQREHDEGKKHICEKCGFGFARLFDLKKHSKIHEKVSKSPTTFITIFMGQFCSFSDLLLKYSGSSITRRYIDSFQVRFHILLFIQIEM